MAIHTKHLGGKHLLCQTLFTRQAEREVGGQHARFLHGRGSQEHPPCKSDGEESGHVETAGSRLVSNVGKIAFCCPKEKGQGQFCHEMEERCEAEAQGQAVKSWPVAATITKRPEELETWTDTAWRCRHPAQPEPVPIQSLRSLSGGGRPGCLSLWHKTSRWPGREVLLSPPTNLMLWEAGCSTWIQCRFVIGGERDRVSLGNFTHSQDKARPRECKQEGRVWRLINGGRWQTSRTLECRKQSVQESISATFCCPWWNNAAANPVKGIP